MPLRAAIDQIESSVPPLMERLGVPGAAVALAGGGQLVWARGFGTKSADGDQPVTAGTVFEAASLSKPLFSHQVLRLCQAGKVSLDAPVWQYYQYPDIAGDANAATVTVRQVLAQQSGLPNWRPRDGPFGFVKAPGAFTYSGEAFVFLQLAVERIAEMPLEEIMRRDLLPALGMAASSYVWRDRYGDEFALGHDADGALVEPRRAHRASAAWSLLTTAPDYTRFLASLLSEDQPRLARGWQKEALTPQTRVTSEIAWGLGWGLTTAPGRRSFWHWGSNPGYRSFAVGDLDTATGVVLLTNSAHGLALCREVVQMALGYDHPAFSWHYLLRCD